MSPRPQHSRTIRTGGRSDFVPKLGLVILISEPGGDMVAYLCYVVRAPKRDSHGHQSLGSLARFGAASTLRGSAKNLMKAAGQILQQKVQQPREEIFQELMQFEH